MKPRVKRLAEIVAAPAYGRKKVCASLPEGRVEVTSARQLRHWLRRINSECPRPLLAEVVRADGDRLTVGLGRSRSFVTYIRADGNPPYLSVVSDRSDEEEIHFDCNGEPSYYSLRNTVPLGVALEVACQFAQSQGLPLPEVVDWEEV